LIDIVGNGGRAGANAVTVHPVVADANRIRLAASAPRALLSLSRTRQDPLTYQRPRCTTSPNGRRLGRRTGTIGRSAG
jgi:hypothetical protein